MHIETNLYKRQGGAITNFKEKLPSPHSELAHATLKNPYLFDFLSLGDEAHEREVEKGLILGRSKVGVLAEYALRDMTKPIGLAEYRLTESLPQNLQTALPSIEALEAELAKDLSESKAEEE